MGWAAYVGECQNTAVRSNAHFTKYAFLKTGGLFDQQPVSKDKNLVPRKIWLDTEKYGWYNKSAVMFFIPVHYKTEKDEDTIILSVELMHGKHFLSHETFAKESPGRSIPYCNLMDSEFALLQYRVKGKS